MEEIWKKYLKKEQGPFLIPPNFKEVTVKSENGQLFKINLKKPYSNWNWIDENGKIIRKGEYWEIATEVTRYPSVLCSFIKSEKTGWIVSLKGGPAVLRGVPEIEIDPQPLTRIRAVLMGKALLFFSFDHRDVFPEIIENAMIMLKREELTDEMPLALSDEQKIAYLLLLEEEKLNRIPPTEQKVKDILKKEGASLISMQETRRGYQLRFNYKGSQRVIEIEENLMLLNAGMCLDGGDRNFSLDGFLSILHNRGRFDRWHDDDYYD